MDLIEVYINDKLVEVQEDEVIALNFAIAKIGEPQFVQSNFSNQIQAPYTQQNKDAFEQSEQINNQSSFAYALNGLNIKQNGVWILRNGNAILEEFTNSYNFSLLSGNIDLFDALGDLTLKDLDLTTFLHTWNRSTASTNNNASSGYAYPVVDYGALPDTQAADEVDVRYQFPVLYLSSILGRIFTKVFLDNQITLSYSELTADTLFNELVYTSATDDTNIDYSSNFRGVSEVLVTQAGNIIVSPSTEVKLTGYSFTSGTTARWDNPNQNYSTPYASEVTFTLNPSLSNLGVPSDFVVYNETVSPVVELGRVAITGSLQDFSVTVEITDAITDIGFYVDNQSGTTQTTLAAGSTINVTIPEQEMLTFGRTFDFNAILPELKLSDFLKNIAFMFGSIFQSNNLTRTVTIKKFDNINTNKPDAVDWSNKVDFRESPEIFYRLDDYAQVNDFNYKEDENVIEDTGQGKILISDEVLEPQADIIDLEFAASQNAEYFTFNQSLAICKVYSSLGVSPLEYDRDTGVENRVLRVIESTGNNVSFTDGAGSTAVNNVVIASFDTALEWNSLLNAYWVTIKAILEGRVKKLSLFLRLTEIDIQILDFFKPVFIDTSDPITGLKINGYFYIEEVKEYQTGKSTEVILVKLA